MGNAVCFALAGEHAPPTAAGVSRVGWLAASWSTEHKAKMPDFFYSASQITEMTR
jgi:hypothetical protein